MKVVVALLVVALFGWLFLRTAHDVRSEPYAVERQHLQRWTLSLETAVQGKSPMLVLRPAQDFGSALFSQIFQRMMESMKGTIGGGMPLVLSDEYEFALAGRYTPQALLDEARAAGLEQATVTPVCVATRRISEPGLTRQMYFVIFDAPAVVAFRERIAAGLQRAPGLGTFEAAALSPVMIIGSSDGDFDRWLPLSATADTDCLAPIAIN